MSEKNVEIVREALARFSAGDFDSTLELISEDCLWEPSGKFIGSADQYRGHDGVRRFWESFTEPWAEVTLEPVEIEVLDAERVLTRTRFRGVGKASGAPSEMHLVHLWTVRADKLARFQSYPERTDALRAAGLSA